ncbi:MAG: folate family ECF transporter S component [Clostridia bacterium]|nr:folate family ECF transporter S component [Clostridia bacterium]
MVKLILCALFIAMQVVLSRFLSINLQYLKIGFSFIPVMFASYLFGPAGGVVVATVSDLVGAIAFPSGAFFPGFTVTAALSGFIYGFAFYKNCSTLKIIAGVLTNEIVCSLVLNTIWLSIMYTSDFTTLLATRVWQAVAMVIVQIIFAEIFFNRLKVAKSLKKLAG